MNTRPEPPRHETPEEWWSRVLIEHGPPPPHVVELWRSTVRQVQQREARTGHLLTSREVAEALGQNEQTIRKHTRQGRYPFARNVGTEQAPRWRYDPVGLTRWLESRGPAAT